MTEIWGRLIMKVKDLMNKNVIKVHYNETISKVAELMKVHNVGRLPVIDDTGRVIGIVTDRDIAISNIMIEKHSLNSTIDNIMTTSVVSISSESGISDALKLMARFKIRGLLVIDNHELVGILTLGDIQKVEDYRSEFLETINAIYS